jgi:hypothetical protein
MSMKHQTDRLRTVCALASDIAEKMNHNFIGSEHMIIALATGPETVAKCALRELLGENFESLITNRVCEILGVDPKELK